MCLPDLTWKGKPVNNSDNTDGKPVKHTRRVRYKGTHPKKYSETYKEMNPEKYPDDVEKIKQRGQTPAGMHRPICVREVCMALQLRPGIKGIDCTLGYGGHALNILPRIIPDGMLIGIDVDPGELSRTEKRIRKAGYAESVFIPKHTNFSEIRSCLELCPEGFDFILADLGVSSMQLDTPDRGFSFKVPGPLDLRLDNTTGETAYQMLEGFSETDLTEILEENANEPYAKLLSKVILSSLNECETTVGLAGLISDSLENTNLDPIARKKTIQRVFQALRIEVNNEFASLDELLQSIPRCLKSRGRVAILTFHSGEDRRVKKSFKELTSQGVYSECVRRPVRPSFQEQHDNPRSSSAKLRWAVKK